MSMASSIVGIPEGEQRKIEKIIDIILCFKLLGHWVKDVVLFTLIFYSSLMTLGHVNFKFI